VATTRSINSDYISRTRCFAI